MNISSSHPNSENGEKVAPYWSNESNDQESFDVKSSNDLSENQCNNNSICCKTTAFRPIQQEDSLSTQYFCESEHVLKNTRADINFPLGNKFMDINKNLSPQYNN